VGRVLDFHSEDASGAQKFAVNLQPVVHIHPRDTWTMVVHMTAARRKCNEGASMRSAAKSEQGAPYMSLKTTSLAVLGAASLALCASAAAAASPPTATIAGTCGVGSGEGYGYTYVYPFSVTRTSCSTGKSLVRHKTKLHGWHCSKKVLLQSPLQYIARMSCSKGRARVTYKYSQNT